MLSIGVCPFQGLIYEGDGTSGDLCVPRPFLHAATVVVDESSFASIPPNSNVEAIKLLFREDSFDPVTRVRRGRLYLGPTSSTTQWRVLQRSLVTFQPAHWSNVGKNLPLNKIRIALGSKEGYSLWDVHLVEHVSRSEFLVTLRLRVNLYPLPAASELSIPREAHDKLQKLIDAALDNSRRLDANATIDACRHAACSVATAWLSAAAIGDDVEKLANKMAALSTVPHVMSNSLRTIAKLHARTKPNVREQFGARENEEPDGEVALSLLALILREARRPCPPPAT